MNAKVAGARETYDAFAEIYEDFNYRYMYERWSGRLMARARAAGLRGKRLLDVGCGSGLSFVAALADGWEVSGCDISPKMIERARARCGEQVTLHVADMRKLPRLGEFDLIWAVNDAMNYLMSAAELQATLKGMRRNLAPGGVIVFDLNTLTTYRRVFAEEVVVERGDRRMIWRGYRPADDISASVFEAAVDGEGAGVVPHIHRQRHFPEEEVLEAVEAAGLYCLEVSGEIDGELERGLDEAEHTKAVYVCRLDERQED